MTRPTQPCCLLLIAASGCAPSTNDIGQILTPIAAGAPTAVVLGGEAAEGEPVVSVKLVNSYQAAVAGGTVTLQFGGDTTGTSEVDLSVSGAATVPVPLTAPGHATVTVIDSSDGADIGAVEDVWSMAAPVPGVRLSPVTHLPELEASASLAAAGTDGVAFAAGQWVWWQPTPLRSAAIPVARLGFEVVGLQSAHIDADGLLDLVVYGGNEVILLRSLGAAGFGWQGGWRSKEGAIVGARATDLNGDRLTDLAVGTNAPGLGAVTLLMGDGAWAFSPEPVLELTHEIWSVTASDETGEGVPVVSVMSANSGTIRRHTLSPDGWVGASDFELIGYESREGAQLLPQADIDGDGVENLVIAGSPDGSAQDFVFYDLSDGPTHYPLTFGAYFATLADLNLDGAVDMLAAEENELRVVRWDGEGYMTEGWTGVGTRGPIAAGEWVDSDALPSVALINDALTLHRGKLDEDAWVRDRFDWTTYNTGLTGPAVVSDLDNDGTAEVIGFTSATDLVLSVWQLGQNDAEETVLRLGGTADLGGDEAIALIQCNADWYALTGSPDDATLTRLRIDGVAGARVPTALVDTEAQGSMLACGIPGSGRDAGGVVVADETGFWTAYASAGLGERETGSVGATGGIAVAYTDSAGDGEIVGCGAADCSVAAADLSGDGRDEIIRVNGAVNIEWSDAPSQDLPGIGMLTITDIDADGSPDVLLFDEATGRTLAYRTAGASSAWPVGWHTERPLIGPVFGADLSGDGISELAFRDADGRILHTEATIPAGM